LAVENIKENTNGLLHRYHPKGADPNLDWANDLREVQRNLNERPRKTLDYKMPREKPAEFLALSGWIRPATP
jgi:IS30 family transposase